LRLLSKKGALNIVSKLFDAIERIHHHKAGKSATPAPPTAVADKSTVVVVNETTAVVNEATVVATTAAAPADKSTVAANTAAAMVEISIPASKKRPPMAFIGLLGAVIMLTAIFWHVFSDGPASINKNRGGSDKVIPALAPAVPRTMTDLNNRGIELIRGNDPWRALYYFDLARQADPRAVEPLINMGVTLSELSLFAPAVRIFKEAQALAPNHPELQANLNILAKKEKVNRIMTQGLTGQH